jgi:hypothetical protein
LMLIFDGVPNVSGPLRIVGFHALSLLGIRGHPAAPVQVHVRMSLN